jgi:hypothetical protein
MTKHREYLAKGGGGNKQAMLMVSFATLLALLTLMAAFAQSAESAERVGPRDPDHGFPVWYQDSKGLLLELCIDGPPLCLEGLPNPNQPASVSPTPALSNFPEEAFWWAGEASMPTRNGGSALLVLAREAAFGGADEAVRDGDQVSFSRVRIRIDNLVPGATYKVTHPYGVNVFRNVAGGRRGINFTQDVGCALSPNPNSPGCNFRDALFGRVDPFLTWDPAFAPAPPLGYVGDPRRPHRVTGSPRGTNFFRIEGPNVGGRGDNMIQTSRFAVQGKITGAHPTQLALRANPARVRSGRATTLSGKLSSFRRPIAGSTVVLQRKAQGAARFTNIGRRTTNANGFYSLKGVRPRANTSYRVTFAGERGEFRPSSAAKRVNVIRR